MIPSGHKQWCRCVVFVVAGGLLLQTCLWIRDILPLNHLPTRGDNSSVLFLPNAQVQLNGSITSKPSTASNARVQSNRSILTDTLLQSNGSSVSNTPFQSKASTQSNTQLLPKPLIPSNTPFQSNRLSLTNTLLQSNRSIVSNSPFQSKASTQSNTQFLPKPLIPPNTPFQSNRLITLNASFTSNGSIASNIPLQSIKSIVRNVPLQSNRLIYSERQIGSMVKTSSPFPVWERPRQFLDQVAEFKITNEDPLAMTLSVKQPNSQTKYKPRQSLGIPKQHRKKLLVMNHPGWNWIQMGNISLDDCPVECSLTTDQAELETSDAVIMYAVAWPLSNPPRRTARQVWIFFSLESPIYSHSSSFDNPAWHGQINWTMTYRHDSDIWYPYGRVNRRADPLRTNYTSLAEKKTHQVAWFVSHCSTQSRREEYANMLKRHVNIDTYGLCGSQTCGPEGSYECLQMLTNKYKFYLSFENALCNDYVTEKIFRKVMISDIVPIVYGRVNYTRYLPPKSFIDVADFDSIASLGRYLNYLDQNVTAYAEYLEWKKYYFVVEKPNPTCEVCMKLTEPEKYRNVYQDIYAWWTKEQCPPPKPVV